jgi:glycosyltransferase involved in cell wall biosynthesis
VIKVLHIINGLSTGGAELALFRLVAAANRSRFEMQVVSLTDGGPVANKIREAGVRVHALSMHARRPSPLAVLRLIRLLRNERPDLVQTWLQQSDLVGGIAAAAARTGPVLWNIRHSTMHPVFIKRRTRAVSRLCAWLSPYLPASIVCCSESSRQEQVKLGYMPRKMVVIPNGVDTEIYQPDGRARDELRKSLHLPPDALLFGAAGRFHPQKDYPNLTRAAGALAKAHGKIHFVFCGDGVTMGNAQLAEHIRATRVAERFHLLGRRDDMPRFMQALDVFVSAACFGEGFPNVVSEAMACRVPCVVTDIGDSARIVGDTGRVVIAGEPMALAGACLELADGGPELIRHLGERARRRIQQEFSLSLMVERYQDLYTGTTAASSQCAESVSFKSSQA